MMMFETPEMYDISEHLPMIYSQFSKSGLTPTLPLQIIQLNARDKIFQTQP